MIKSIFVEPDKIVGIEKSGANHLIVGFDHLNQDNWLVLKKLNVPIGISLSCFNKPKCPLDPNLQERLFGKIKQILEFQPDEIWFDYFRFGGECSQIKDGKVLDIHPECEYCKGKNRVEELMSLAVKVQELVDGKAKVGYFAVALKENERPELVAEMGVNYTNLRDIFDLFSPMLYHRMLGKDISYISEYVRHLALITLKPILPIIQIKDMPDDLEDKMSSAEIRETVSEALKPPSLGVCVFVWTHALEKNKTEIISKILSSI